MRIIAHLGAGFFATTALVLSAVLGRASAAGRSERLDLAAIRGEALRASRAPEYLDVLTRRIGPRLTGSAGAEAAVDWASSEMKDIGLRNVHLEPWALRRGWKRGLARAEVVSPRSVALHVASYGWAGSTHGAREADVIAVDAAPPADGVGSAWVGKVLLVQPAEPPQATRAYAALGALARAAEVAGAVAIIRRDPRPGPALVHAEPLSYPVAADSAADIAVLDVSLDDHRLLSSLLAARERVRVRIDVENRFSTGPVTSWNVVGEIPGRDRPQEIVIVGAHLDSWDLGPGAIDDAFGAAAVLASADALLAAPARPRRTIRFVLFTGEEQGLLGSRAYVEGHRDELDSVICAMALDWGAGPISVVPVAGHEKLVPALRRLGELDAEVGRAPVRNGYLFATDAYAFTLAGLPGIAPLQDSPDYSLVGHSAADTPDRVDPRVLASDAAFLAETAFWISNHPERLGVRWTPERTAQVLERDGQRPVLEALGLWPPGGH